MPSVKKPENKRKIIFVTGMSGAGMSSALKVLEDFGYEVFDNFPLSFIEQMSNRSAKNAIGVAKDEIPAQNQKRHIVHLSFRNNKFFHFVSQIVSTALLETLNLTEFR